MLSSCPDTHTRRRRAWTTTRRLLCSTPCARTRLPSARTCGMTCPTRPHLPGRQSSRGAQASATSVTALRPAAWRSPARRAAPAGSPGCAALLAGALQRLFKQDRVTRFLRHACVCLPCVSPCLLQGFPTRAGRFVLPQPKCGAAYAGQAACADRFCTVSLCGT